MSSICPIRSVIPPLDESNLALWGGVTYVMPRREATLLVKASGQQPGREVKLIAEPRPRTLALDAVTLLDQIAGALVVLGAAYLVWIRSGAMTWAFFTYTIQFNPGQSFQFYAWLQQWPRALLAQDVSSCVLQAAGYTGLLLFALRAPVDRCEGRWRGIERAQPALAILFLAVALMSLGALFGYPTEFAMRASILYRLCGQRRRARDFDRPSQGSVAARLPADPLGDLGLPHRPAGLPHCRNLAGDLAAREPVRRGCGDGGRVGSLLSRQRDSVRLCRGGGAPPDRGQRLDPTAPRDRARPLAQRAGVFRP